jgi:hypothetical protein
MYYVSRVHIPKVIELLKEKVAMGNLGPSSAPYSNQWFRVPKQNGSLRFIQDLQSVNKVTLIQNSGVGPIVDKFTEAFVVRVIYSIGELFELAIEIHDITAVRTPIGLVWMCTLPQGATNLVTHIIHAINKVRLDCI